MSYTHYTYDDLSPEVKKYAIFGKEVILDYDIFQKQFYKKELEALAQVVQNLIITEPGTYPNQPDLGVGIENYLFDLSDPESLHEIKINIDKQIKRFISPSLYNIEVLVRKVETSKKNFNSIIIECVVRRSLTPQNLEPVELEGFSILIGGNLKNKTLLTKLYC